MTFYPAPAGIRMSVLSNPPGTTDLHVNVWHFARRDGGLAGYSDCVALVNEWKTYVLESYRGMMYTDHSIYRILAETVSPEPRVAHQDNGTYPGTRVIATEIMPGFVCCKLGWTSGYRSRRWRGRSYIGGLREQDNTDGSGSTAYQALQTACHAAFMSRFGASGASPTYVLAIMSDPDNVLPLSVAPVGKRNPQLAWVSGTIGYSQLFTLRRRMAGVGR